MSTEFIIATEALNIVQMFIFEKHKHLLPELAEYAEYVVRFDCDFTDDPDRIKYAIKAIKDIDGMSDFVSKLEVLDNSINEPTDRFAMGTPAVAHAGENKEGEL